ncbi:MAG: hypothetical protein KKH72_12525 [Alphaproteobacteria bacterium]|nr:hypothetical protein [Alphaproteobacteria bacterium]
MSISQGEVPTNPSTGVVEIIRRFWWAIPIILFAWWFMSLRNELVVERLSSEDPFFSVAMVTAEIYNKGDGHEYSYHIELGGSDTEYCSGSFFIGSRERRRINFDCTALDGYTGTYRLITMKK